FRCSPSDASCLSKFLLTRTLKEPAVTANPLPYPPPVAQATIVGRCSPPPMQTTQQPDVLCLSKFLLTTTLQEPSPTANPLPSHDTIEDSPPSRQRVRATHLGHKTYLLVLHLLH
uniref:Uncharacterized protein n=1 Tax=Triticum urartu TaxID=4572 RepID=A0A8R7TSH8_TRIUA